MPQKLAGILAPLFSIYSEKTSEVGEIADLAKLIDWAKIAKLGIIQLLPLNATGLNNSPYAALSSFALDPLYIAVRKFPAHPNVLQTVAKKVDYSTRERKLVMLKREHSKLSSFPQEFESYKLQTSYWLPDYALYKIIKTIHHDAPWYQWDEKYRMRDPQTLDKVTQEYQQEINFIYWIQWQLYSQLKQIKQYATSKGIMLMGDMPILTARDSADVWAHKNHFDLEFTTGSPPSPFFVKGQRWDMPPYNWETLQKTNYRYFIEKLKYADNFYHLFRLDHFVGLFRFWVIQNSAPQISYGASGEYRPNNPDLWKQLGEQNVTAITSNNSLRFCAEDLGSTPEFMDHILNKYNIKGIDIQRWMRDWTKDYEFKDPESYRRNSVSAISNHDISPLVEWWKNECGQIPAEVIDDMRADLGIDERMIKALFIKTPSGYQWSENMTDSSKVEAALGASHPYLWVLKDFHHLAYREKEKYVRFLGLSEKCNVEKTEVVNRALQKSLSARSDFSIQQIQDWFSLDEVFDGYGSLRINTPGKVSDDNWTFKMPMSLEEMLESDTNRIIAELVAQSGRI